MMKTQSPLLILLFLVSTLAIAPSPTHTATPTHKPNVGSLEGYQPIKDVKVPHVQEIAKFAVSEYNKQHPKANLKFDSVIKGEYQVVAGVNYRLVIAAKKENNVYKYLAIANGRPWEGFKNLTSFKPLPGAV